jgi:hypothetical protein
VAPTTGASISGTASPAPPTRSPATRDALTFPGGSRSLPVKWFSQILPGSTHTNTCGQATTLGIYAYRIGFTPVTSMIQDEDNFLNSRFPGRGYATANSNVTYFTSDNTLGTLIHDYFHFNYGVSRGTSASDLQHFINAVNLGYPVIACCEISNGFLVSTNAVDHWVTIVGYTSANGGGFYINNSGTGVASKGDHVFMSIADFDKSWAFAGRWWAIMYTGVQSPAI